MAFSLKEASQGSTRSNLVYMDPQDATITFRIYTQTGTKRDGTVVMPNRRVEFSWFDTKHAITYEGDDVNDVVLCKLIMSANEMSKDHLLDMLHSIYVQASDFLDEGVHYGLQPATTPAFTPVP
jgi:hypothetical protein